MLFAVGQICIKRSHLRAAVYQSLDYFDALHIRMILIGDFIFPHPKAATRIHAPALEFGNKFIQDLVAMETRRGITVRCPV